MRVYIAGPIAGKPDQNRTAFKEKAQELEAQGHEPVNPHEVDHSHSGPCFGAPTGRDPDPHHYGCYLLGDMQALATCDAVVLLRGYSGSKGATAEIAFADACGIPVFFPGQEF